jgi:hypothetical protein
VDPQADRQHPRGASAGPGKTPDAGHDEDVIQMGGPPPGRRWGGARGLAVGAALVALAAALLLGVSGGHHRQPGTTTRPAGAARSLTAGSAAGVAVIGATGSRCAVQLGRTLQLGIEIINQSDRAVAVRQVRAVLPLGGLRAVATQQGPCGLLPQPGPGQAGSLAPRATRWLAVTFDVLVSCPQPLPVGFKVSYVQAGQLATSELSSFPDLGQVRYSYCRTHPAG